MERIIPQEVSVLRVKTLVLAANIATMQTTQITAIGL